MVEQGPPVRLHLGPTLRQAARLYASHWPLLLSTAAIAFVTLDVIAGIIWPVFAQDALSATIAALITIGGSIYYQGMVATVAASARPEASSPGLWQTITAVPAVKLIVVDVLASLAAFAGLAVMILPGLVVFALTAVVAPVTVLERPPIIAAFRRSTALVRPSFWLVLSIVFCLWMIVVVVTGGLMLAADALTNGSLWGHWAGALLGNLLIAPIAAVVVVSAYFQLTSTSSRTQAALASAGASKLHR